MESSELRDDSSNPTRTWGAGVEKIGYLLSWLAGIVLIVMTLMVVADVALRFVLNRSIEGAAESTEVLMPYIVFWAMGYALLKGDHVRVTLLLARMSDRWQMVSKAFGSLIGIGFFGLLMCQACFYFWDSLITNEQMMALGVIYVWIGKFAFPLGLFVMFLGFVVLLFKSKERESIVSDQEGY